MPPAPAAAAPPKAGLDNLVNNFDSADSSREGASSLTRSGGRLVGPRCRSCLPYANNLGRSRSGRHRLASNICASARAAAPRAAHG
eukprot:scaffold66773_cov112-Phaeocystis_antarctica.AAC.2